MSRKPHFSCAAFQAYCTVTLRFVGGFGLLTATPLNWYAPTSHAPLAGRAFEVPLQTD